MAVVPGVIDVRAFLQGDPDQIRQVRAAMEIVVRALGFADGGVREELVEESLARVFLNVSAGRFRGESSLATYAQNVAKYTCLEYLRRCRQVEAIDCDSVASSAPWSGPEALLLRAEEHRRNLRALASLPAECRELFHLVFVEGLSYREVAGRLGISEGAVKLRVHRCRLTGRAAAREPDADKASPARKEVFWRLVRRAEE